MPQQLAQDVIENLWFGDEDPERTRQEASRSLAAQVAKITGLKPFPAVAQRVMQMVADPNCKIEELGQVIKSDPAIAARVMRLANSALFRVGQPVGSLDQALMRLGTNTLYQMVTAIAVMGLFNTKDKNARRLRDHSVGCAALAKALATRKNWPGSSQLFLCGLMHDLGQLLLLQTEEVAYDTFTPEQLSFDRTHLRERQLLGYDHAVLGGHVIALWNLPELTSQTVAWHHQPARAYDQGGDLALLVAFVRLADELDDMLVANLPAAEAQATLGRSSAANYLELSVSDLELHWEALLETRKAALGAMT
jgi:HD-like signal output (HDOD) protein